MWADGRLVQANLNDWRIQWNTPMRVMLPLDATEVLLAVPYPQIQGYAVGSMFIGPADAIDQVWQLRNFWQADAPRAASLVALLLMLMGFHLLIRPDEVLSRIFDMPVLKISHHPLWRLL